MYHLGFALYKLEKLVEAARTFCDIDSDKKNVHLQRDIACIYGRLGNSAMEKKDFSTAVNFFKNGLQHAAGGNETKHFRKALAICYYNQAMENVFNPDEDAEKAEQLLDKAGKYNDGSQPEIEFLHGLNLLKTNNTGEALQIFQQLCENFPDNKNAVFHRALVTAISHRNGDARDLLADILSDKNYKPYWGRARMLSGCIELWSGNWKEAEAHLQGTHSN